MSHCDARFAPKQKLGVDKTRRSLKALLDSYVATMQELNIDTWIAHGTLLGWYWNRKLLPWDTDLDVQMSSAGIASLAISHNMTKYRFSSRTYLLDINPHYSIVSTRDVANKIDARWIDTTTGKFIDITAVHRDTLDTSGGSSEMLFCKDGHQYKVCPSSFFLFKLALNRRSRKMTSSHCNHHSWKGLKSTCPTRVRRSFMKNMAENRLLMIISTGWYICAKI